MLSVDDLVVIFGFLKHDALDAVEVTCRCFAAIVKGHFDEVVHCKLQCVVRSQDAVVLSKYTAGFTWAIFGGQQSQKITASVSELDPYLRRAAIHSIRFECVVDMDIVNALQPCKNKFCDAYCTVPRKFSSMEAFVRAFSLALFCDRFTFNSTIIRGSDIKFEDSSPSITGLWDALFTLPAFKQCSFIHVMVMSNAQFPVKEVADWLHANDGKKKKELLSQNGWTDRTDFADLLLEELLKASEFLARFRAATSPASFDVTINFNGGGPDSDDVVENAVTEENLTVKRDCDEDGEVRISVKREPMKVETAPGATSLNHPGEPFL